ncbi:MAG: tripartite tricarboxylate transporter substrate binding protein, partial [Alphaproteobacteria bacterium]
MYLRSKREISQVFSRGIVGGLAAVLAIGLLTDTALADKFPTKPIQVVIHASYGGGTDTTARMMMIRSRRILKTDMSVIAKRGGSGAAAHEYAMGKPRDGYTILALTQSHLYTIA